MVAGQMDKATLAIHTTKAPRPKPHASPHPKPQPTRKASLNKNSSLKRSYQRLMGLGFIPERL